MRDIDDSTPPTNFMRQSNCSQDANDSELIGKFHIVPTDKIVSPNIDVIKSKGDKDSPLQKGSTSSLILSNASENDMKSHCTKPSSEIELDEIDLLVNPRITDSRSTINRSIKPLFEGFAYKLCPKIPYWWQRRYFVIRPEGCIYYFYNRFHYMNGDVPRGIIDMADIRTDLYTQGVFCMGEKLYIAVHSKGRRIYKVWLGSSDEALAWAKLIRMLIPNRRKSSECASARPQHSELAEDLFDDDRADEIASLHGMKVM